MTIDNSTAQLLPCPRSLFRTRPREIEAVQFHGVGHYEARGLTYPEGVCFCDEGKRTSASPHAHVHTAHDQVVLLAVGDWISPEPDGRGFYPIKPDIFEARYEPVTRAPVSQDAAQLVERLRQKARTSSETQRMMAQAKSLRQEGHDPPRDDLYMWSTPEQTIEWQAADLIETLTRVQPSIGDMGAQQIKHMANRFLMWRLPEDFHPDAGISFEPEFNVEWNAKRGQPPQRHQPTGTNLFGVEQAERMVRFMVEGLPLAETHHGDSTK